MVVHDGLPVHTRQAQLWRGVPVLGSDLHWRQWHAVPLLGLVRTAGVDVLLVVVASRLAGSAARVTRGATDFAFRALTATAVE